jgi:hypothetical protein
MIKTIFGVIYILLSLLFSNILFFRIFKKRLIESYSIGFILINLVLPFISFILAWIFKTNINYFTIFLPIILLIIFIIFFVKFKNNNIKISDKEKLLLIIGLIIFFIYLTSFKGPFLGYWDTYIAAPAITMTGQEINFVDINNTNLYEYTLKNKIPDDLIDKKNYGIISKDQRIGSGIIFSIPFFFFGLDGFKLQNSLFIMFGFFILYFLILNITKNYFISILVSFFCFINGYILSINTLNPNLIGFILSIVIIHLSLQKEINWYLLGFLFGIFGSIRSVAIIFSIPIGYLLIRQKKENMKILYFLLIVLITILPTLIWNNYAYDNYFIHSSQYFGYEGFRPEFEHFFLGNEFEFNGLLNYPMSQNIVRTPHYSFPVFIYLLLLLVKIFGIFFFVTILFGMFSKVNKKYKVFLLLWLMPFYLFLSFQENWEVAKTTYILLVLPVFLIFLSIGIKNLFININYKKSTYFFIVLIAVIIFYLGCINNLNYNLDQRWYDRFPKAYQDEYYNYNISSSDIDEFKFFQSTETLQELNDQRIFLKSYFLFPYFNFEKNINSVDNLINKKNMNKNVTIFVIWKYIYV